MPTNGSFAGYVFDPEVFASYIAERDPIRSPFIRSNVIVPAPSSISGLISGKNNVVTIPFYQAFNGDALNYDGLTDNDPVTHSGSSMTAMAYRRMKAWTEQDFTHELTGSNGLEQIAMKIGDYQAKENEKTLLSILKGIEGVSAFSGHVNNIASTTPDTVVNSNRISLDLATVVQQKALGDHMDEFQVWVMHSAVFNDLMRLRLATETLVTDGLFAADPIQRAFAGHPVILDDSVTAELNATTNLVDYHTYLCGTGLFMTAPARIDVPNYVDYDPQSKGGMTALYTKWGRLLHPYGFSFKHDNLSIESPANSDFADSANWEMKYESKNIPLVSIISNVASTE